MTSSEQDQTPPLAVVTGASRGLGRALVTALAARGWHLVVDAREPRALAAVVAELSGTTPVTGIPGDVADPVHRQALAAAVRERGDRLDLLVNNAGVLGPSPLVPLSEYPVDVLERVYAVNTVAPLALVQLLLPALVRAGGQVVNLTSDAAVEAYPGWGGYGSAKAALDQISAVLAVEQPEIRVHAFDPGDMATDMQQQAYPGEDVSDRARPDAVVPALLRLLDEDVASGRHRADDLQRGRVPG